MLVHPYHVSGRWLRGNLHAHTKNSDGKFSLEELVRNYEALGYDFLVITDHNKITAVEGIETDMLLLRGCEISTDKGHITAVNLKEPIEPNQPSQKVIDTINAQGGVAILAHPNWGENFAIGSKMIWLPLTVTLALRSSTATYFATPAVLWRATGGTCCCQGGKSAGATVLTTPTTNWTSPTVGRWF